MKFILMANIFAHNKNDEKTALIFLLFEHNRKNDSKSQAFKNNEKL